MLYDNNRLITKRSVENPGGEKSSKKTEFPLIGEFSLVGNLSLFKIKRLFPGQSYPTRQERVPSSALDGEGGA